MSLRIVLASIVLAATVFGEAPTPAPQVHSADEVVKVIDRLVEKSKSNGVNSYYRKLFERTCEDVMHPDLHRLERRRAKPQGISPQEIVVLSIVAHDEEFPGVDHELYLTKQGIPTVTVVGPTPAALKMTLEGVKKHSPPFKKIFIQFSSHGKAFHEKKTENHNYIPSRKLALSVPADAQETLNNNLVVAPEFRQRKPETMTKFEDYLQAISDVFPKGGRDIQIAVDSCMSGAGMEDWLRLQKKNPDRRTQFGLALTALGSDKEYVTKVSTFEQIIRDALVRGGYMDRDANGVVKSDEFTEFAEQKCRETASVHIQANPYFEFPVLKTGEETAIAQHQQAAQTDIYDKAIQFIRQCKACIGDACKPHKPAASDTVSKGKTH